MARPRVRTHAVEENQEDDWVVSEGSHEAIIPRPLFDKAQALKDQRCLGYQDHFRRGSGAKSDYLLTGVIQCAQCGHTWQGHTQCRGRRRKDGSQVKTKYYACGGYITKGNSVCQRCVIQKDAIEGMLLEEIGKTLRQFVEGDHGRAALKGMLEEMLCSPTTGLDDELARLRERKADVERRIFGILDNITAENREFADARIRELKKELRGLLPRIEELQAASEAQPDLDELTDAMLGYMADFQAVVAEGTVDERRRLVRAFTRRVVLDPQTGKGRAELLYVPKDAAPSASAGNTASSPSMVAGAGFEPATFRL